MSINNVLLFVSTTSQNSISPIKFIREHDLPVLIVRLDTIEDRVKAANGPIFKVTEVPTLVVFYTDNTMQLFTGSEKILAWMNAIIQSKKSQEVVEQPPTLIIEEEQPAPKKSKKSKKKKVSFDTIEILEESPIPKKQVSSKSESKSRNSEIMNMAKKMEKERDTTLNYNGNDKRFS